MRGERTRKIFSYIYFYFDIRSHKLVLSTFISVCFVFFVGSLFPLDVSISAAISSGRVLDTEKLTRNCVSYVLSRIFDRESDRIRLALLRILAVFWGEVCRAVFIFFRDIVRGFYDVVIFSKKNQHGIFRYISTFQPKKWPLFQINRV